MGQLVEPSGERLHSGGATASADSVDLQDFEAALTGALRVGADPLPELPDPAAPLAAGTAARTLATNALNDLGLRLLAAAQTTGAYQENSVVAPAASHLTLMATRLAATADESDLDRAFGWSFDRESAVAGNSALLHDLTRSGQLAFTSLGQEGYPVGLSYLEDLIRYSGAYPRIADLIRGEGDEAVTELLARLAADFDLENEGWPVELSASRLLHLAGGKLDLRLEATVEGGGEILFQPPFQDPISAPSITISGSMAVADGVDWRLTEIPLANGTSDLLLLEPVGVTQSGVPPLPASWQSITALRQQAVESTHTVVLPSFQGVGVVERNELRVAAVAAGGSEEGPLASFAGLNATDSIELALSHHASLALGPEGMTADADAITRLAGDRYAPWRSCPDGEIEPPLLQQPPASPVPAVSEAKQPFLAFVVDRQTGAALYAAQIVAP